MVDRGNIRISDIAYFIHGFSAQLWNREFRDFNTKERLKNGNNFNSVKKRTENRRKEI
jgi:hypothetical protein